MRHLSLPALAEKLGNGTWMVKANVHANMCSTFERFVESGMDLSQFIQEKEVTLASAPDSNVPQPEGDVVGIINIHGVLAKYPSLVEQMILGCIDIDEISAALDDAANDPTVTNIICHWDSPGGETIGIEELGRKIAYIDENIKPIYSWTETGIHSAAYWLASQTRKIGMTPSAEVGSVGVFSMVVNEIEKNNRDGIEVIPIVAGKYKGIGHSWHKLTDEEKKILQTGVDNQRAKFRSVVNSKRPDISMDDMEGLAYEGEEALAKHYVDVTADSFDDFLTIINNESLDTMKVNKVKATTSQNAQFADAIKQATAEVNGLTAVAAHDETKAVGEVVKVKAEEQADKIPGLPGVSQDNDKCDDMEECSHCKGTGKVKAAGDNKTPHNEPDLNLSEPDDDDDDSNMNKSETVSQMSAEDFRSAFGIKPSTKHSEREEFHKMLWADINAQNKRH